LLAGLFGLGGVLLFACAGDDPPFAKVTEAPSGMTEQAAPTCTSDPRTAQNTAAVVDAATTFLARLTPAQRAAVLIEKTLPNAQRWSNVPGPYHRNGVRLGDMNADARAAAVALVEVAAGPTGAALFSDIREADEYLVIDGDAPRVRYGRGMYFFSIHGTPSTSSAWMLQVDGHHLAYNFMYSGHCTSATPLFDGVEPASWTDANGAHAPLDPQISAFVALLSAVRWLPGAKLAASQGELVNGPVYEQSADTRYPTGLVYPTGPSGRGAGSMSAGQKALVKTVIEAWVNNAAEPVARALLDEYESDEALAQTFVAYAGSSDLTTAGSYARIDGPRVWIEVSVRSGVIYDNRGHYHTLWRDKVADYGAELVAP
jgi:hypothetical protein